MSLTSSQQHHDVNNSAIVFAISIQLHFLNIVDELLSITYWPLCWPSYNNNVIRIWAWRLKLVWIYSRMEFLHFRYHFTDNLILCLTPLSVLLCKIEFLPSIFIKMPKSLPANNVNQAKVHRLQYLILPDRFIIYGKNETLLPILIAWWMSLKDIKVFFASY